MVTLLSRDQQNVLGSLFPSSRLSCFVHILGCDQKVTCYLPVRWDFPLPGSNSEAKFEICKLRTKSDTDPSQLRLKKIIF